MNNAITITIQADGAAELARLIGELNSAMSGVGLALQATDLSNAGAGEATVTTTKKGKSAKTKAEAKAETETVAETGQEADAPGLLEAAPVKADEPEHPVSDNVVTDLTPEKAREAANKMMQEYFLKVGEGAMKEVAKLQSKYGVKQFADVPLPKAHDFLADVRLATTGAAQAA